MSISRFSRVQPQKGYKRLSFQEMAFAPMQMRQREDSLMNARDAILNDLNNKVGYDDYNDETNQVKQQLHKKFEDLTNKIHQNGAGNLEYMDEFRNLRNEYNKAVSQTGVLGMSSALKQSIDAQKAAYYADAYKKGHAKQDIDYNWLTKMKGFKEQLPGKLGDYEGSLPSFDPGMAPEYFDKAEKAIQYNKLMGAIEQTHGEVTYQNVPQPDGSVKVVAMDSSGKKITNKPQIDRFVALMEQEMLNPSSKMRQYMDYTGQTVQQMLEEFDMVGDIMLRQSEQTQSKARGGTGTGTGSGDKRVDKTTLETIQGNASTPLENTQSTAMIDREITKMSRGEGDYAEMDPEELNAVKGAYLFARRQRQAIEDSPEFRTKFNETMASDNIHAKRLRQSGINTWDDYLKLKNDPEFNKEQEIEQQQNSIYTNSMTGKSFNENSKAVYNPMDGINNLVTKVEESVIGALDKNKLSNSEQYEFGMGDSDEKSKKLLAQSITGERLKSLLVHKGIEIENEDGVFEDVSMEDDNGKLIGNLSDMIASGQAKVNFAAINSGDAMSTPEIMLSVTGKNGEDAFQKNIAIDLGKDPTLANMILGKDGPLYEELDYQGKLKFNAMRDNIKYRGLAIGASADMGPIDLRRPNERFTETQTNSVAKYAKMRDQEIFGFYPQSTEDPNSRDGYALQNQFFRKEPGVEFNVEISKTGGYRSFKRKDGEEIPFTFKDLVDKEYAAAFLKANARDPETYPMSTVTDPSPEQKEDKARHILSFVTDLMSNASNLDDMTKSMSVYNPSQQFKTAMMNIYHLKDQVVNGQFRGNSLEELERNWNLIANKHVESKSPKIVL